MIFKRNSSGRFGCYWKG